MYKVEYLDSRFTRVHTQKINENVPLKVSRIFSISYTKTFGYHDIRICNMLRLTFAYIA